MDDQELCITHHRKKTPDRRGKFALASDSPPLFNGKMLVLQASPFLPHVICFIGRLVCHGCFFAAQSQLRVLSSYDTAIRIGHGSTYHEHFVLGRSRKHVCLVHTERKFRWRSSHASLCSVLLLARNRESIFDSPHAYLCYRRFPNGKWVARESLWLAVKLNHHACLESGAHRLT